MSVCIGETQKVTITESTHTESTRTVDAIYNEVVRCNAGEVEFHQAVREVLESLSPVLWRHPEFIRERVIERICEPERQVMFRVPWVDDKGRMQINRGF